MPPPRRVFPLGDVESQRLINLAKDEGTAPHVRNAAVILLTSVDTPACETVAKILGIDKREVNRAQKAYLAKGVSGIQNLELRPWDELQSRRANRKAALVARLRHSVTESATKPKNQRDLASNVGLSKDYVRKILKNEGLAISSAAQTAEIAQRVRDLLRTTPKKHPRWTYLEAAKILGIHRSRLTKICTQFGIVFPRKKPADIRIEMLTILQRPPQLRTF